MKKHFYLMGLMIGLVVSGLALSACGSDDDGKGGSTNGGGSDGGGSSSSLSRVKKLVEDEWHSYRERFHLRLGGQDCQSGEDTNLLKKRY